MNFDTIVERARNEPVLIIELIKAALVALVAFGVGLTPEQIAASVVLVSAGLALVARRKVTPVRAPELTGSPVLRAGDVGLQVEALQKALDSLGLDVAVTGLYSNRTRDAVGAFQSEQGLPVTGAVDVNTAHAVTAALRD